MYKVMTKDLQDKVIDCIVDLDNTGLNSLKSIAKKFNLDPAQVVTTLTRNKKRIVAMRAERTQEAVEVTEEQPATTGGDYMIINEIPKPYNTAEEEKPVFVWNRTKKDMENKTRFNDDEKLFIAAQIEQAATEENFSDGTRKFITSDELTKLSEKYFISIPTLMSYMKAYTNVKRESFVRVCRTPSELDKRRGFKISKDILEQIISDLKETSLLQHEIALMNNVSDWYVSNVKIKLDIERPDEEDEEVKKKTKGRRAKFYNNKNKNNPSSNKTTTGDIKETKKEEISASEETSVVEVPIEKIHEHKDEPEIVSAPPVIEEVAAEEPTEDMDSYFEEARKPGEYTMNILNNRSIHRIGASTLLECVLVNGRHSTPVVKGVFEQDLDQNTMFDYEKQLQICEDFIATNLKFDDNGRANKSIRCYCTGLQSPLVSFIKACDKHKVNLTCMHYNSSTKSYFSQSYSSNNPTFNDYGLGVGAISKEFGNYIYRYKCTVRDIEQATNPLFIIICNENAHTPDKKTTAAIVCSTIPDYKELFMLIVSTMINIKPEDFNVEVRKFNFNSNGEVIKNTLESYYEIK